jgi:2'-5' RNA ligase
MGDETGPRRALLDAKLTELGLYATELYPEGAVEMSTVRYEDEDGHVTLIVPPACSEEDEDRMELALAARADQIFEATGLLIVCGVLDRPEC